jgi:hypothetical protein
MLPALRIKDVERITLRVPFTERVRRWNALLVWQWQIVEVIVVTTDDGSVGYGETLPHYTWGKVSDAALERVRGCNPAALLGDDSLGSGLQMAIYDETRCKLHGGMSTGPRTDAGKAASALGTHGIYAAAMNPEEVEAVTQADDTLANELLVARVQSASCSAVVGHMECGRPRGAARRRTHLNSRRPRKERDDPPAPSRPVGDHRSVPGSRRPPG